LRAFDDHRPPDPELVKDCIHCGFCLPTCPSYLVWGEEMDSPRGRIVLMRQGMEPGSDMGPIATHFDRCLGCMACVTACPSGVRYDRLIEATRPQVERNTRRPFSERAFRRACFELFTHPGRLRALVPLTVAARRLGLDERLRPHLGRFPRLAALAGLAPDVRLRSLWRRLPIRTPARAGGGASRARVGFLQGCVQRVFFPGVNEATVRVLSAEGFEVFTPPVPRCCGALMLHSGAEPEALGLARETIAAFEDCDAVVVNAAGCGSAMKDYGHLLSDDPAWADRAAAFSAKVRDVTELLTETDPGGNLGGHPRAPGNLGGHPRAPGSPRASRHPLPLRAAYHDACHLAHAQGVRSQPRALLGTIPGLELAEPAEWEVCCGSAGIYNLLQPEAAGELGRRKAANLAATGAEAIVAGNPGCTLQIAAHLAATGRSVPIYHPVELLDASIRGTTLPKGGPHG
jgi:glycolate oxidase iron-sulfur subunit